MLDKYDLPIGTTAGVLQSQLGILARKSNLAPLTYTDWRAPQLNPYKERIWDEVKVKSIVMYCTSLVHSFSCTDMLSLLISYNAGKHQCAGRLQA